MLFKSWRKTPKAGPGRTSARPSRRRPHLEVLEDRTLLAISLTGVPNWIDQGPGPLLNGQVEGMPDNPVAGAVRAIATHPFQPDTILIGSVNGGIWRTTNASAASPTWTPLIDDFPSLSITSIAFSPRDGTGNTIYAGVGAASSSPGGLSGPLTGLLKSTNGGTTWQLVGPELRGLDIREVVPAASTGPEVVLAATNGGLFRSTNGGLSFTPVQLGNFTDLVRDTGNTLRFYAARIGTTAAILRSDDVGLTWTRIEAPFMGIATAVNIKLAVNRSGSPDPVYAGVVGATGALSGIFRSADTGNSWQLAPLPGTIEPPLIGTFVGIHPLNAAGTASGRIHFSLAADPNDPDVVYVGGSTHPSIPSSVGNTNFTGRLFRGDFTPAILQPFWSPITNVGANSSAPHADSRDMTFDIFGNLLEADDGGIYRLRNPSGDIFAGPRVWSSVNGNLRITELLAMAYDSRNNVILAGTQDNGSVEMIGGIGSPDPRWRLGPVFSIFSQTVVSTVGDGNIQAVDLSGPNVIRYSLNNELNFFTRRTFNPAGDLIGVAEFVRLASPATPTVALSGLVLADRPVGRFSSGIRFVLNAVTPSRMLIGFNGLYESTDRGDTLTVLETAPANPADAVTALAYGGFGPGGTPNVGVLYVARASSGLALRPGLGLPFVVGPALPPGSGAILDIVLDPDNFRTAYVVTSSGRVFRLDNVGQAGASVTRIDGNLFTLGATGLKAIEVFRSATGQRVVLVGGRDGVYRTLDSDGATPTLQNINTWHEFGTGLPNARVTDIRHDPTDDLLLVSTLGRGAWTMAGASAALVTPATLTITGDAIAANQNDAITLVRNAGKPWMLDVFLNAPTTGAPSFSVRLSTLQNIVVNSLGGNDTLTVDSVNGPVAVPGGIQFDGGAGAFTDTLDLRGGSAESDFYAALPGSAARSTILFLTDDDFDGTTRPVTQTVNTLGVEAVRDFVEVLTGTMTLDYSALNLTDTLTLQDAPPAPDPTVRVTSTRTAPIQLATKRNLVLNAGDQADRINLVNTATVPGSGSISVNARGGIDTINVEGTISPTLIDAGADADIINVGAPTGTIGRFETLEGITSTLTVRGGPGADTLTVSRFLLDNTTGQMDRAPNSVQTRITGLGMSGQILFEDVTNANVGLGLGGDRFTIVATAASVTTTVHTGSGDDTVVLGPITVNDIRGPVIIDGGTFADTVILQENEPAGFANVGSLGTPANAGPGTGFLSGFGMGATVNFSNVEGVVLIGGPSSDFVTFPFASAPSFGISLLGIEGVTFQGTERNDRIRVNRQVGRNGPEVVAVINGQTLVAGYQGGTTVSVFAGRGNDEVIIDASVSTWRVELFGEGGNDHLVGGLRDDLLDGGRGNDVLEGGAGNDDLIGGRGNDLLLGDEGDDVLNGGSGLDLFWGGLGADRILASDGDLDFIFADIADVLIDLDHKDRVFWL